MCKDYNIDLLESYLGDYVFYFQIFFKNIYLFYMCQGLILVFL